MSESDEQADFARSFEFDDGWFFLRTDESARDLGLPSDPVGDYPPELRKAMMQSLTRRSGELAAEVRAAAQTGALKPEQMRDEMAARLQVICFTESVRWALIFARGDAAAWLRDVYARDLRLAQRVEALTEEVELLRAQLEAAHAA